MTRGRCRVGRGTRCVPRTSTAHPLAPVQPRVGRLLLVRVKPVRHPVLYPYVTTCGTTTMLLAALPEIVRQRGVPLEVQYTQYTPRVHGRPVYQAFKDEVAHPDALVLSLGLSKQHGRAAQVGPCSIYTTNPDPDTNAVGTRNIGSVTITITSTHVHARAGQHVLEVNMFALAPEKMTQFWRKGKYADAAYTTQATGIAELWPSLTLTPACSSNVATRWTVRALCAAACTTARDRVLLSADSRSDWLAHSWWKLVVVWRLWLVGQPSKGAERRARTGAVLYGTCLAHKCRAVHAPHIACMCAKKRPSWPHSN